MALNIYTSEPTPRTPSILFDPVSGIFEMKGKFYRIQLWDLAGQDKNTCITKIFCKEAHGCVILADITNRSSLTE